LYYTTGRKNRLVGAEERERKRKRENNKISEHANWKFSQQNAVFIQIQLVSLLLFCQ